MTWFKVDDGWHKHRKRIRIGMDLEGFAARGLWVDAGSWASDELTDGWIPAEVVEYLAPGVGRKLAERLVRAQIWGPLEERNGEEGWQWHDWEDWNPTRAEELAKASKKAAGGILGNHRRWHDDKSDPKCPYCATDIGTRSVDRSHNRSDERGSHNRSVDRSHNRSDEGSNHDRNGHNVSVDRSVIRNGTESLAIPPSRPDPTPSVVKEEDSLAVASPPRASARDYVPNQDLAIGSEEKPAATKGVPERIMCPRHIGGGNRVGACSGCADDFGDRRYFCDPDHWDDVDRRNPAGKRDHAAVLEWATGR